MIKENFNISPTTLQWSDILGYHDPITLFTFYLLYSNVKFSILIKRLKRNGSNRLPSGLSAKLLS